MPKPQQPRVCPHPDRPYQARGMCQECYIKWRYNRDGGEKARAYSRLWSKKYKNKNRFKKYGLSHSSFNSLWKYQEGRCAICQSKITKKGSIGSSKSAVIDHNHVTEEVRGLLCSNCNKGLGCFKDNPLVLKQASFYLETHL